MASILIVEDDEPTQILLSAVARRNRLQPSVCANGREALERLRSDDYAAIILDLLLPEVDGMDVLREIARKAPDLLGRVVVVTAASRVQYEGCAELQAVHCVLRKPFELAALEEQILECAGAAQPQLRAR